MGSMLYILGRWALFCQAPLCYGRCMGALWALYGRCMGALWALYGRIYYGEKQARLTSRKGCALMKATPTPKGIQ